MKFADTGMYPRRPANPNELELGLIAEIATGGWGCWSGLGT